MDVWNYFFVKLVDSFTFRIIKKAHEIIYRQRNKHTLALQSKTSHVHAKIDLNIYH